MEESFKKIQKIHMILTNFKDGERSPQTETLSTYTQRQPVHAAAQLRAQPKQAKEGTQRPQLRHQYSAKPLQKTAQRFHFSENTFSEKDAF